MFGSVITRARVRSSWRLILFGIKLFKRCVLSIGCLLLIMCRDGGVELLSNFGWMYFLFFDRIVNACNAFNVVIVDVVD